MTVRGSWLPAVAGTAQVARAMPWGTLARRVRQHGLTPLAVLWAHADERGGQPALADGRGILSWVALADAVTDLADDLRGETAVIVRACDARTVALGVLAGLSAGVRTVVVPSRSGTDALAAARSRHPGAALIGDAGLVPGEPRKGRPESGLRYSTTGTTRVGREVESASLGAAVQALAVLGTIGPPRHRWWRAWPRWITATDRPWRSRPCCWAAPSSPAGRPSPPSHASTS